MTLRNRDPLSDKAVQAAKPVAGSRITKVRDRDGLFLHITEKGNKSWVMRYRIHGKERSLALGQYPEVPLKKARERAQEARRLVADGVDPVQHKRRLKAAAAQQDAARFEPLSIEWRTRQAWSPAVRNQYDRLFRTDINPKLGRLSVSDIGAPEIQAVIDDTAVRGKVVAGHVLLLIRGVLSYAVTKKLLPFNAAREIKAPKREKAAKRSYRHLEGTTAVRGLLDKLEKYRGNPETILALRLLLLTFVRPSELREAPWSEFDLDAVDQHGNPAPVWHIAADRTKRGRPHVVPLSRQATTLLQALHKFSGSGRFLFPHSRRLEEPMSRNTLIRALRDYMGLPTTAHGFRHLASTTLNSQGYNRDWIEMQLAHWNEGVRGAYNKAQWLPERRGMMQAYADWLDCLHSNSEHSVVPFMRKAG